MRKALLIAALALAWSSCCWGAPSELPPLDLSYTDIDIPRLFAQIVGIYHVGVLDYAGYPDSSIGLPATGYGRVYYSTTDNTLHCKTAANASCISTGSGTVTSVSGTANQIASTGGTTPALSLTSNQITHSIQFVIDGGGVVPATGAYGQIPIPAGATVTGWVITADQSGSAVVDVLRSTYSGFPTTSSIAGSDKPTLSSVQKNENLGPLSGWGSTAITAGDEIQINLNSATTVTRINLTLIVTVP